MKGLYIFTALLFACALFVVPQKQTTSAEETPLYAVADSDDVWFYSEPNGESGLFLMPHTYYVLVLAEGEEYCAVRYLDDVSPYKSVTGYCKTQDLTFVDFIPARPYLRMELTVSYSLGAIPSASMGNGSFDSFERKFVYYGESYLGTTRFHYVYSDGVFDYIPAVQEITFEKNVDYLAVDAPTTLPEPPAEEKPTAPSAVQIVCVCLSVLAVLAICALVLRGKKAPLPQEEF